MKELPRQNLCPGFTSFSETVAYPSFSFCLLKYYYVEILINFRPFFLCSTIYTHSKFIHKQKWLFMSRVKFQCI